MAAMLASCGSGGGFPDAAHTDGPGIGQFAIAWSLVDGGAQPITCAQAGATSMLTTITNQANGAQFSSMFACTLGSAVSGTLAASTYELRFSLLGASGTLATVASQTVVLTADHTTPLAPIQFVVTP
ncbi:MAG: hypothetical protein ABI591_10440 [Kofleriaceae bacterium]